MLRITQTATEIIRQPSGAELRVSQSITEVVRAPANRTAHISQLVLEVLRPNVTPQNETTQQPQIIIVAG